jgi:mRNA interferase HigB
MKVHLIKYQTVEKFVETHARSRVSFNKFINELKIADWKTPMDISKTFGAADLLGQGSERVVFDVGGNTYRIICKYFFGEIKARLFICWIGTHAEYDKLCAGGEQYSISAY